MGDKKPRASSSELPSVGLTALAHAYGVQTSYVGHSGARTEVSAATLIAILDALHVDGSTPEAISTALQARENEPWLLTVPHTVVVHEGETLDLLIHVNHGDAVGVRVVPSGAEHAAHAHYLADAGTQVFLEQLDRWVPPREIEGQQRGRATFQIPGTLPLGYHQIIAETGGARHTGTLVVVPHRAQVPDTQSWGLMTQLYSVRSADSWGVGDLGDLAALAGLSGRRFGADFVLVNPLHAVEPVAPLTPSPYLPVSRRFLSTWYIRVEDVPEAAYVSDADRKTILALKAPAQALNVDAQRIDRDLAWTAKLAALRVVFSHGRPAAREDAFQAFKDSEGQGLEDFALWCALYQSLGYGPWPQGYESPSADLAQESRSQLSDEIEFQMWLQWVADEQLAGAQTSAKRAGMRIGIMQDLAVGVHPHGADVWIQGDLLARKATVGAPPDMYNQLGQNWSQPPWQPLELERSSYAAFRAMLRAVFRNAGAVRIDHIIGLFRLWWIPRGFPFGAGAYVSYNHEALIGILCLEANRAGVVVIGEDLGTFEHWVSDYLDDRGLLGTSVLWFEKSWGGVPRPPQDYRWSVLASVTTHDLPPTAGYLADEHVALRESLGLLTVPVEQELAAAKEERDLTIAALKERGLTGESPDIPEIVSGLHRYLAQTHSRLLGVSLADAVGERRTQNQPGTDQEYPNWRIPLADSTGAGVLLDDLLTNERLQEISAIMNAR